MPNHIRAALAAPLLALLLAGCADTRGVEPAIRNDIRAQFVGHRRFLAWFRSTTEPAAVDNHDVGPIVQRFYRLRRWEPAWSDARGPNGNARELADVLAHAGDEGLDPREYDAAAVSDGLDKLKQSVIGGAPDPAQLAAYDLLLTRSCLKYAIHVTTGQMDPRQLPADWHMHPSARDWRAPLEQAVEQHRIGAWLASLDPPHAEYADLKRALAQYRAVENAGGWPVVPAGAPLKPGSRGARVSLLRQRLAASGDLDPGARSGDVFDPALAAAVRHFQIRHGLPPSGTVGRAELAELDLPVGQRVRQIELNMERWRWMRAPFPPRDIVVNIPDYSLRLRDGNRDELAMRVVVGKEFTPTPMFADQISYLVINPVWNVPPSIASKEILPEVQKDPSYLTRNHMRLFDGDREVDASSVDWSSVAPDHFPYTVRQDPGADNAVGHMKFMCPNQFDIYLHDTPANQLFNAKDRDFSHGCVRVERPMDLAVALMQGSRWDRSALQAAVDSASNLPVTLPKPVPVYILYWTSWVDDQGVEFRSDVYSLDSLLDAVLRKAQNPRLQASIPVIGRRRIESRSLSARPAHHDLLESRLLAHLVVLAPHQHRHRPRRRARRGRAIRALRGGRTRLLRTDRPAA
ncbi:MAG TPA: L,D-transpeptidase family protein [Gemmatimonadales bacterium]|nr:L,D-transpeptidase family protein [Gemmatimonadales bacterium]